MDLSLAKIENQIERLEEVRKQELRCGVEPGEITATAITLDVIRQYRKLFKERKVIDQQLRQLRTNQGATEKELCQLKYVKCRLMAPFN